jgi:hypothetical protein
MRKICLLALVGLFSFIMVLGALLPAPIDGMPSDDARRYAYYFTSQAPPDAAEVIITHRVHNSTLDLATWNLTRAIWQAAQRYRQADRLPPHRRHGEGGLAGQVRPCAHARYGDGHPGPDAR